MREDEPFSAWIEQSENGKVELWCSFDVADHLRLSADRAAASFVTSIKSALDECVRATAAANCESVAIIEASTHLMPLFMERADFAAFHRSNHLQGLRPDQIRSIELIQPFKDGGSGLIARCMTHLTYAIDAVERGEPLFCVWASEAAPRPELPDGVEVSDLSISPAGIVVSTKRLATFHITPSLPGLSIVGDPNVSFDLILNAPPWPIDPDDNLEKRSHLLLTLVKHFIEGLERSVNDQSWTAAISTLDALMPEAKSEVWLPVKFNDRDQEEEARAAIKASEQDLATIRYKDGTITYMRLDGSQVVGREIRPATALGLGESHGVDVEDATRAAASKWGLPDFVLAPSVIRKGSGTQEIGDGTIWSGDRGITLQVKARGKANDAPERARSWLLGKSLAGLKQARGTMKNLARPTVELTNLRGRPVKFAGSEVDWVPVVILEHPNPPLDVIPASDPIGPSVVLLRRDWEFLWDQLRSASAIVDYIHRVASEEPIELGTETQRYFELARKDLEAPPNPQADWIAKVAGRPLHLPTLPTEPAAASDEVGHAVFQRILEDIAATNFTGDERQRIHTLTLIDRVAVGTRAELGRILLRRLGECAKVPSGQHRVEHRVMLLDQGNLHLAFTTMTQLTGIHHELYSTWLLHRRQTFLAESGPHGLNLPWTVGVVLTPRADGPRPWDTTVVASDGPPQFDDEEFARLTPLLAPNNTQPPNS